MAYKQQLYHLWEARPFDYQEYFEKYIIRRNYQTYSALREVDLHAYLYFNVEQVFPQCEELLVYERSILNRRDDLGVLDFLYRTSSGVMNIEVKYLNRDPGKTAKVRRTKHRNKLIEQTLRTKEQLLRCGFLEEEVECGVFHNDGMVELRARRRGIQSEKITRKELLLWMNENCSN